MACARSEIRIEIPGVPPSLNDTHKYGSRGGRVFKYPSKGMKAWRDLVEWTVKTKRIAKSEWYGMSVVFHLPLYHKNGKPKRLDVSNLVKYAEDEVCKRIETVGGMLDDSRIIEIFARKEHCEKERTEVLLYCCSV
jgi:Holliday junction resolvase RusA-like endonuclease